MGMTEAACDGQLLSEQSRRASDHIEKQTQERSETAFDHRRVLEAGYALVMSLVTERPIITQFV